MSALGLTPQIRAHLDDLTAALTATLGDGLRGVCVYGSAARGEWRAGVSDVNLLVETGEIDFERIDALAGALRDARRGGGVEPLLLTEAEIRGGADAFAVLVEDIRRDHVMLLGESALIQASPTPEELRLGAERALRGAHMRLRRNRMGFGRPGAAEVRRVYRDYTECMASLKAVCALSGRDIPTDTADAHALIAEVLGVSPAPLTALREMPLFSHPEERLRLILKPFSDLLEVAIERADTLPPRPLAGATSRRP